MNKFFRKLPLQAKLMLIGLIPFSFVVFLTVKLYNEKTEKLNLIGNYIAYMQESENINGLIDAMQEERKFSFDYAITKSKHEELLVQRPKTDAFIQKIKASSDPSIAGFQEYTKLGQINNIRNSIDHFKIPPDQVMHFYSNTIFRLNTLNTIPPANTPYLQPIYKDLMAQRILSEMIAYLGIIRSNIYNVLNTKMYMVETLIGTVGTHDIYKSYDLELRAKATPELLEKYEKTRKSTALKPTTDYIENLFTSFQFNDSLTASQWWKISDEGTNELRNLQSGVWKTLKSKIDELYRQEKESRSESLIFLIIALACVVISIVYIVHIITQTLDELRAAAEKISNGETNVHIKVESYDALGCLANSISTVNKNHQALTATAIAIGGGNFDVEVKPRSDKDELGIAIVNMQNELKKYNRKMETLVTDRTEELSRSNDDLQQFAHVASHDLKEPLRKIMMFSNILSNELQDNISEKAKQSLDKIGAASLRMSDMIEGILAYSTVNFNDPISETVNLNTIIVGVTYDLEYAISAKGASVHYSNLPEIKGTSTLLQQLFHNLINNALKFAKEDVPAVITIASQGIEEKRHDGKLVAFHHITLSDNGIGFNQDYAEKIFGIFLRLNTKEKYEGTGLGLALCRKIVERHQGEIYAEGKEGEGAIFHILLPVN